MAQERKIDRFDKFMTFKGLNDNQVTHLLGLSIGTLGKSRKENRDLSDNNVNKVLDHFKDLNKIWLLTGEGSMLNASTGDMDVKKLRGIKGLTQQDLADKCGVSLRTVQNWEAGKKIPDSVILLLQMLESKDESISYNMFKNNNVEIGGSDDSKNVIMIPVLNLDARGGFLSNDEVSTPEYITKYEPFSREVAREGDIVIPIFGDSMAPKYPSGTMVLIRKIELWKEYIEYGASYVLELIDERRLIKNVQNGKSKDTLLLVSINEKYEPAEIAKNLIKNVFRVLMSVRREAM